MDKWLLVLLTSVPLMAASSFEWKDHQDGRLELLENGRSALVYNYGQVLKPGVPEDRRRCCYLFPVLTPEGVSVLDDFPKDHYHHRGLFWAWPGMETADGNYDSWMMQGVKPRFVKWLVRDAKGGRLKVENGWFAGEKRLIRETVSVVVEPVKGKTRTLHVELKLDALDKPVTLRGAHDKDKSYGGFSARFAPRTETVIRTDTGEIAKRDDLHPHQWAELEATYAGRRAALRITPDAKNAGFPHQWCLRDYGFVGASFPGRTDAVPAYTIQPAKPLVLRFTVTLSDK